MLGRISVLFLGVGYCLAFIGCDSGRGPVKLPDPADFKPVPPLMGTKGGKKGKAPADAEKKTEDQDSGKNN